MSATHPAQLRAARLELSLQGPATTLQHCNTASHAAETRMQMRKFRLGAVCYLMTSYKFLS